MRLRTVLIAAGVVIGLPVVGAAIFVATFDANAYKPRIAQAVKDATGRELALNGPIALKLGLSPALRVEDVAFANAPWGSRPEMARLSALEVQVAVLPLLSGTVAVKRVALIDPDILLETNAEGVGNWEFAPAQAAATTQPASPSAPAGAPATPQQSQARQIAVGEVTIENGTLAFRDGRAGTTTTLALPRFTARADSLDSPLTLDLAAALNGNAFTLAGTVGPVARLTAPAGPGAHWPVDLTLGAAGAEATIRGALTDPKAGKGYDMAVQATVPDLSRLAPFLPDVELPPVRNLAVSVQAADRGGAIPEVRALTLRVGESDLNALVAGLRLARVEIAAPDAQSPVRLAVQATLNGAPVAAEGTLGPLGAFMPGTAAASWPIDLRLTAAGAEATAKGAIARPAVPEGVDVAITARIPDLAALSPLAGGAALPAIKDVTFSARALDRRGGSGGVLRDIALKIGASDVTGMAELEIGARPKLTADLASRKIDADALMAAMQARPPGPAPTAPAAPAAPAARPPGPARMIPDTPLPLHGLRMADAAVKLAIAELVFGGATYRDASATIALDRGNLRVDPLRITAPGAPVTGRLSLDASNDTPPVAIVLRAPAIDLRQLIAAFGGGYRVAGQIELDVDLKGAGASPHAIAAGLNGHVAVAGANLDIDNRLIDLVAGEVWRAMVPGAPRDGTNNVRCLALRFDSTDGTAEARAMLFDSALAKVSGTGSVLLGPEQLRLRALPTLRIAGGGIGIPVDIGGTFLAPSVRANAAGALGALGAGVASGAASGATVGGPLGAIVGGVVGAVRPGGAQTADDCPAQLAIARGGRPGPAPAPEPATPAPEQQQAPTQQAPTQQRPANPLQQLIPRLGR